MSDCQQCININDYQECECPEHEGGVEHLVLWDNDPASVGECPCFMTVADVRLNQGCDDYHRMSEDPEAMAEYRKGFEE